MGQKLRGLIGQSVNGQRKAASGRAFLFPKGTYIFNVPQSGWWRFALWGAGGGYAGGLGGGGGGFIVVERALAANQNVGIVVAAGDATSSGPGNSILTMPNGEVLVAGSGSPGPSGAGGAGQVNAGMRDIAVSGNPGLSTAGGAGASYGGYLGGTPSAGTDTAAGAPGGGCGGSFSGVGRGGDGLAVVQRVRMRLN